MLIILLIFFSRRYKACRRMWKFSQPSRKNLFIYVSKHFCIFTNERKFIHYGPLHLGKAKFQKSGLIILLFLVIQLGESHNSTSLQSKLTTKNLSIFSDCKLKKKYMS